MKIGWLIRNAFFHTQRLQEQYDMLVQAFALHDIELQVRTNAELCDVLGQTMADKPDFVLSWDKDICLLRRLEDAGIRVFNSSQATLFADDKAYMYTAFARYGVPMPRTVLAPMTYSNIGYPQDDAFLCRAEQEFGYPMVVKHACSSYGMGVYLVHDRQELTERLQSASGNVLMQQFVSAASGRDTRVYVVGDTCVCAVARYNPDDFRSNILAGGTMTPAQATPAMQAAAIAACRAVGADFGGVDLLTDESGQVLVCEINTSAHFGTIYHTTGINVADAIASYIVEQIYGM